MRVFISRDKYGLGVHTSKPGLYSNTEFVPSNRDITFGLKLNQYAEFEIRRVKKGGKKK